MKKIILVAGGTGNLGHQIVLNLLNLGATVRVLVRPSSDAHLLNQLEIAGAEIIKLKEFTVDRIAHCCEGVSCVVSALSGLEEVILGTQKTLLDAAVSAGVPRFIPSDYSLDFTPFDPGENRNLDWRRTFHTYLDQAPIKATSIFNGAFADLLTGQMPMIFYNKHLVTYWGSAHHQMTFTTIADTANYTAHVALDEESPRYLRIASDQLSARMIKNIMTEITGKKFYLIKTGGQKFLGFLIKITKSLAGGADEIYPAWQGMQYMHNMIDDRANVVHLDNDRYPTMEWTPVKKLLKEYVEQQPES